MELDLLITRATISHRDSDTLAVHLKRLLQIYNTNRHTIVLSSQNPSAIDQQIPAPAPLKHPQRPGIAMSLRTLDLRPLTLAQCLVHEQGTLSARTGNDSPVHSSVWCPHDIGRRSRDCTACYH